MSDYGIQVVVTPIFDRSAAIASGERQGEAIQEGLSRAMRRAQPLGRITGQASEFEKSMEAANARVLAFGASAGSIYLVKAAFEKLLTSTIQVEQSVANINVILGLGNAALKVFSADLFKAASAAGQTFETASKVALEFARHGVSSTETLKRMTSAMQLMRISGLDAQEAVNVMTASINAFNREGLTSVDIVNRLTAVDTRFAVSAQDLAKAIERVGSTAAEAGIQFNELLGFVTAAQTATSRGGAVIGNAFKSIFTRLARPQVLEDLASIGVVSKNSEGQLLPMAQILKNLAREYSHLSEAQKSFVSEAVGGVYQVNILKASLADLGNGMTIFDKATITAGNSIGFIDKRMELLNQTIASKLIVSANTVEELFSNFGNIGMSDKIKSSLDAINSSLSNVNQYLFSGAKEDDSTFETMGKSAGAAFAKGIGGVLAGWGVQTATLLLTKSLIALGQFAVKAAKDFTGMNNASKEQAAIQGMITSHIENKRGLQERILKGEISEKDVAQEILELMVKQNAELQKMQVFKQGVFTGVAPSIQASSIAVGHAAGFIPNFANQEISNAKSIGYNPTRSFSYDNPVLGKVTVNNGEFTNKEPVPRQDGKGFYEPGTFVVNPMQKNSVKGIELTPIERFAAGGFIPNFASIIGAISTGKLPWQKRKGEIQKDDFPYVDILAMLQGESGRSVLPISAKAGWEAVGRLKTKSGWDNRGYNKVSAAEDYDREIARTETLFSRGSSSKQIRVNLAPKSFFEGRFRNEVGAWNAQGFKNLEFLNPVAFAAKAAGGEYEAAQGRSLLTPAGSGTSEIMAARMMPWFRGGELFDPSGMVGGDNSKIKNGARGYGEMYEKYIADFLKDRPDILDLIGGGMTDRKQGHLNALLKEFSNLRENAPENDFEKTHLLAGGFIPNFATKFSKNRMASGNFERRLVDTKTKAYLDYYFSNPRKYLTDNNQDIDFTRGMLSINYLRGGEYGKEIKGEGFKKFNQLVKIARRTKLPIYSSALIGQPEAIVKEFGQNKNDSFEDVVPHLEENFSDWDILLKLYPQLKYRNQPHLKTRGEAAFFTHGGKDNGDPFTSGRGYQSLDFKDLDHLKKQIEGLKTRINFSKDIGISGLLTTIQTPEIQKALETEESYGKGAVLDYDDKIGPFVRQPGQPSNLSSLIERDHPEGLQAAMATSKKSQGLSGGFIPNFAVAGVPDFMMSMLLGGFQGFGGPDILKEKAPNLSFGADKHLEVLNRITNEYLKIESLLKAGGTAEYNKKTYGASELGEFKEAFLSNAKTIKSGFSNAPEDIHAHQTAYKEYSDKIKDTEKATKHSGFIGSMVIPFAGGQASSILGGVGALDSAKALQTLTDGATMGAQALMALPNKAGAFIAGVSIFSSASKAVSEFRFGAEAARRNLDIINTRFERLSTALTGANQAYEALNQLYSSGTASLGELINLQRSLAKSLAALESVPGGSKYAQQLVGAGTSEKRAEVQASINDSMQNEKNRAQTSLTLKGLLTEQSHFGMNSRSGMEAGSLTATTKPEQVEFLNIMKATAGNLQNEAISSLSESGKKEDKDLIARMSSGTMLSSDVGRVMDKAYLSTGFGEVNDIDPSAAKAIMDVLKRQLEDASIDPSVINDYKTNLEALKGTHIAEINLRRQYSQTLQQFLNKGSISSELRNKKESFGLETQGIQQGEQYNRQEKKRDVESLITSDAEMIRRKGGDRAKQISNETSLKVSELKLGGSNNIMESLSSAIEGSFAERQSTQGADKAASIPVVLETTKAMAGFLQKRQEEFSGKNSGKLLDLQASKSPEEFALSFLGATKNEKTGRISAEGAVGVRQDELQNLFTKISTLAGSPDLTKKTHEILHQINLTNEKGNADAKKNAADMEAAIAASNFKQLSQIVGGLGVLNRDTARQERRRIVRDEFHMKHSNNVAVRGRAAADLLAMIPENQRNTKDPRIKALYDASYAGVENRQNYVLGGSGYQDLIRGGQTSSEAARTVVQGGLKGAFGNGEESKIVSAAKTAIDKIGTNVDVGPLKDAVKASSEALDAFADKILSFGSESELNAGKGRAEANQAQSTAYQKKITELASVGKNSSPQPNAPMASKWQQFSLGAQTVGEQALGGLGGVAAWGAGRWGINKWKNRGIPKIPAEAGQLAAEAKALESSMMPKGATPSGVPQHLSAAEINGAKRGAEIVEKAKKAEKYAKNARKMAMVPESWVPKAPVSGATIGQELGALPTQAAKAGAEVQNSARITRMLSEGSIPSNLRGLARPAVSAGGEAALVASRSAKFMRYGGTALKGLGIAGAALGAYESVQDFRHGEKAQGVEHALETGLAFAGPVGMAASAGGAFLGNRTRKLVEYQNIIGQEQGRGESLDRQKDMLNRYHGTRIESDYKQAFKQKVISADQFDMIQRYEKLTGSVESKKHGDIEVEQRKPAEKEEKLSDALAPHIEKFGQVVSQMEAAIQNMQMTMNLAVDWSQAKQDISQMISMNGKGQVAPPKV